MKVRVHALIFGRVQGVFYRAYTCEKAGELGVLGWVRNLPDGRVEAMMEGKVEAVESLLTLLKSGPAHARVEAVETEQLEYKGAFESFHIR